MMRRAGGAIRRRWARLLRGCGHGLLPQRKGFPVCGNAHAAKDEWRCRFEQGMAAVLPFRFRANDAHAVGAERKNRECRRVGEARLAVEAFDERRELWGGTEFSGNSCLHVSARRNIHCLYPSRAGMSLWAEFHISIRQTPNLQPQ